MALAPGRSSFWRSSDRDQQDKAWRGTAWCGEVGRGLAWHGDVLVLIRITKADPKRRMVFGWANLAATEDGKTVIDLHGDVIPADVLERASYDYVARHREGGLEHQKMGVATLIEAAFIDAEKLAAMGVETTFKGAGIWIGMRVDDPDVWAAVESGALPAFSIGGAGSYEEIEE